MMSVKKKPKRPKKVLKDRLSNVGPLMSLKKNTSLARTYCFILKKNYKTKKIQF